MTPIENLSNEALAALVNASAAINAVHPLDHTLTAIAQAAADVMGAAAASVIMLDPVRNKQVFRAAVGDRAQRIVGAEYDAGVGISAKALEQGQTLIVHDAAHDAAHYKGIDSKADFSTRSLLACPLIHKDRKLGVVEVINPIGRDRFTDVDAQMATVFGNLAAIAIVNAQLCERLQMDNRGLKAATGTDEMIGRSDAIEHVRDLIRRVARSASTVLILGETGTGKELVARRVHDLSDRAERPFIAVNCAALPDTLLESELFGHEAGAFTGAAARKLGRFELANGGTIFLDEIAEIEPDVQVKLLRVLQEREIVRVGGTTAIACDVRVIAATNRDLAERTRNGQFREDLYYRLNVFPIEAPPLRLRREDIGLLVAHFVERLSAEMKLPSPTVSTDAMAALTAHDYPGNIRELRNLIERACLLAYNPDAPPGQGGTIEPVHLPAEIVNRPQREASQTAQPTSALQSGERAMILSALEKCRWNQTQAAKELGISRDNLRYRIKKYQLKK